MSIYGNNLLLSSRLSEFNYNPDNLTLVFDTSKEPANNTVSVPLNGTVNCTINWGDGTSENHTTTGFKTHTYANPGIYVVQISGIMTQLNYGTGTSTNNNKPKLVRCLSFGSVGLTSLARAFRYCVNLIQCPEVLPSEVISLLDCFSGCRNFNDGRCVAWNTSSVTNMQQMFENARDFNQPIGNWNTSRVTNMVLMFQSANSFAQDISGWDIRQVTNMTNMFNSGSIWGTANYDAALITWSQLVSPQTGVTFGVGANKYSSSAASARNVLTNTYGWNISDGGEI